MCNCKYALLYQCICNVFAYVIYMPTYRINLHNTRTYVYHFFEKKEKKEEYSSNHFYQPIPNQLCMNNVLLEKYLISFKLGKLTLCFSALRLFPNKRIC